MQILGQPENRSQQLIFPSFEPAFYLRQTGPGYFSILQKLTESRVVQNSYPMRLLTEVLRAVDPSKDTYITPNQFFKKNRRVVSLAQMNAGFSDLDTYRANHYSELTPEAQAMTLMEWCAASGLPLPSIILFSGRGLQVKYLLDPPLPYQALPRWNACQAFLIRKMKPFGADPACSSASSVLRLDQTVNTKSGEMTRVLWPPAGVKPVNYSFDEFAGKILPFTREEARERRERAKLKVKTPVDRVIRSTFNLQTLYHARLSDLRTLAHLRGWNGGNPDGERDPFLFYGATFLSWLSAPGLPLFLEIAELAREWCPAWGEKKIRAHVSTILRMAKDARRYKVTNDRLLTVLQIEASEEAKLKTIISKKEQLRRLYEKRRAAGMISREEYEAQVQERREKAMELRQKGLNITDIAKELELSRMHVYRILSKV